MPPAKRTHPGNLDVEEHNTDVQNQLQLYPTMCIPAHLILCTSDV